MIILDRLLSMPVVASAGRSSAITIHVGRLLREVARG